MTLRRRLLLACLEDRVTPTTGVLDPTFDADGRATTDFAFDDRGLAMAQQPDGRLVVAGYISNGIASDFAVARFNPDGSLDTTFNASALPTPTNGNGRLAFGLGANDKATCVAIQPDGKIVFAGYAKVTTSDDFVVARLNADGSFDSTFDGDGKAIIPFNLGGANSDLAEAVAIQSDGKIVVGGSIERATAGDVDFGFARLNANGSLDSTFGSGGLRAVYFDLGGTNEDRLTSLAIQPDGKIVAGGYARTASGVLFAVARLTSDGSNDGAFDTDGVATINFGFSQKAYAVALQLDGRIVVAGVVVSPGTADFAVARLNSNGSLDTSDFNPTGAGPLGSGPGRFTINFGAPTDTELASSVVLQRDGKIVLGGYTASGGAAGNPFNLAMARVTAAGALDTTFDADGRATVDFGASEEGWGLAIDTVGRILIAGSTTPVPGDGDFALARLGGDEIQSGVQAISKSPFIFTGETASFTVTVTSGGSTATNAPFRISQVMSSGVLTTALTGVTYTSSVVGGVTGNTSGVGFVNDLLTIPSGAYVTYTVTGTVPIDGRGSVRIRAEVEAPEGTRELDSSDNVSDTISYVLAAARPLLVGGPNDGTTRVFRPVAGKYTTPSDTLSFFPASTQVNVRTAVADVNGDGLADYIVGTGPGAATEVTIQDGKTGTTIGSLHPFEATFTGGVFVAAADFDGDGKADVIVTPDQGGGPVVVIYDGALVVAGKGAAAQANRFFGIEDPAFRGGARPAAGDINADGRADLVVSAGFLGGPRIAIFDGTGLNAGSAPLTHLVPDFFAFEDTLRNGAFVAVGDVTGDLRADLAFGGGPGGAPRVRLFNGNALVAASPFPNLDAIPAAQLANFFAGDSSLRGGVRMTLKDVDADGKADLTTGSGEAEASRVRVFTSATLLGSTPSTPDQDFDPFTQTLANGVFVG